MKTELDTAQEPPRKHTVRRSRNLFPKWVLATFGILLMSFQGWAQTVLQIHPSPDTGGYLLTWELDDRITSTTTLRLERSQDLEIWEHLIDVDLWRSVPDPPTNEYLDTQGGPTSFYRLIQGTSTIATVRSAGSGDEIYGFSAELERAQEDLGEISVSEFLERYQVDQLLDGVSYDSTAGEFWDALNQPVELLDPDLPPSVPQDVHLTDFRLNEEELESFKRNGFVVSGRKGDHSYTDTYYKIFTDDLPVFVSLDSVLHAWHQNYRAMLAELEETVLANEFFGILSAMREQLPAIAETASPALAQSLNDADVYLTVAVSLFDAKRSSSILEQSDPEIAQLLALIEQEGLAELSLFGRTAPETVDFSQFKPRGHYTRSELLQRYFKAAMWCGRTDLRVAGPPNLASERELATAIILQEAMTRANKLAAWTQFDEVIGVLVGLSDSMTVPQLAGIMEAGGIENTAAVESLSQLTTLQQQIEAGDLGAQAITSHGIFTSGSGPSLVLPRSFTLFGQRFVMDSWAFSQVVFDRVFRNEQKLGRRLPSGVDIAFTVMGNESATDILADRIQDESGVPFRDGYPIQHQLGAVHDVFDAMPSERWQENVYNAWLFTLRQMSRPYDDSIPEVFRTRAWARKNLCSQLASWAQLRHNTVLYAKQSYSPPVLCSFPHSFVEPNVDAWAALEEMARLMSNKFNQLNIRGVGFGPFGPMPAQNFVDNQIRALNNFASTCERLKEIAEKQNTQQPLSATQKTFLQNMVEVMVDYVGQRTYSGWYTKLYYIETNALPADHPSIAWDPVVTDVHTDLPSPLHNDPGTVLHEAVGNTAMMIVSVNCLQHRVYAGPVSTYYEFTSGEGNFDRMTDEEWKQKLIRDDVPAAPEWTQDYWIPGTVRIPSGVR